MLSPKIAVLRLNLAYALTLQGQRSEAEKELLELLWQHPKDARINLEVALKNLQKETRMQ